MNAVRIVVDTGVFYYPHALRDLARQRNPVVIPAVAFAERIRQLRRDRRPVEKFEAAIARSRYTVEPFGREEAFRILSLQASDQEWQRYARDALIAGHVRAGDHLWTTNPRHFERLGVDARQLIVIGQPADAE